MSSCGAIMASRSFYSDAKRFYEHFGSTKMKEREFVDLAWNEIAVKLQSGEPYWGKLEVLPQEQFRAFGKADSIVNRSRDRYGTPRSSVERKIRAWARRWLVGGR